MKKEIMKIEIEKIIDKINDKKEGYLDKAGDEKTNTEWYFSGTANGLDIALELLKELIK